MAELGQAEHSAMNLQDDSESKDMWCLYRESWGLNGNYPFFHLPEILVCPTHCKSGPSLNILTEKWSYSVEKINRKEGQEMTMVLEVQ